MSVSAASNLDPLAFQPMVRPMVWSLLFPETEAVFRQLVASECDPMFDRLRRAFDAPECQAHAEFLDTWCSWSGIDFGAAFPNAYVSAGSSEAIRTIIMGAGTYSVHAFRGEYEGYHRYAQAPIVTHERSLSVVESYRFINSDQFWISHPSAIDGEYWDDLEPFLATLHARHPQVKVYLDVAYHGIAKVPRLIEAARFPNIAGVIFSLSKLFGAYRFRIGGCVTRQEVPGLVGNKWFNNHLMLKFGTALLKEYPLGEMARRYAHVQTQAIGLLKNRGELPPDTEPSNVLLLARSTQGLPRTDDKPDLYKRAPGTFRYCLTPALATIIYGGMS